MKHLVFGMGNGLHQLPEFPARRRGSNAEAAVHCLVGGQVMLPRAYSANTGDYARQLFGRFSLNKFFKSAQGHDMDFALRYISPVVQLNGYRGMSLDSRDRLNVYYLSHDSGLLAFAIGFDESRGFHHQVYYIRTNQDFATTILVMTFFKVSTHPLTHTPHQPPVVRIPHAWDPGEIDFFFIQRRWNDILDRISGIKERGV
jgi:hypothetical protein